MKTQLLSKYIISILLLLVFSTVAAQDTLQVEKSKSRFGLYGVRVGVDISKPLIQLVQKEDLGYEFTADVEVYPKCYVAMAYGTSNEPGEEDYLKFHTQGSFAKIGFNYNTYQDWAKLNNEIYVGLRYGYSGFSQKLISYTALDLNDYFGSEIVSPNTVYDNLNAHWAEMVIGIKVQLLKNLFLTTGVEFKKLISDQSPDGFANLYIPGFNRVYANKIGAGFNYTIAYLIPLKKGG